MKRRHRILGAVMALGAATALTLTACSSSDDSGSKPAASDAAATELLNKAADATAALTGAHLTVNVDGPAFQSLNATAVEADVNTKPNVSGKGTATLNMGNKTVKAPFVYLDESFYANIDDQGWINYGDGRSIYDVSQVLNPDKGVPHILRSITGAKIDGTEDVDGAKATKVTGTVAAKDVTALTGASGKNATESTESMKTTVWITDQNQVAKVVVAPSDKVTLTVGISKWNSSVEVTKPDNVKTPSAKPTAPPAGGGPTRGEKAAN
ncbi:MULTISPECIES: LppX_LprAFG lipoprotein [unclassified Gordonia (in: high G+C Gram-positive bacteria)]|uniref:LppX_LprAFG lipoprotein n=1 Tax=unclassified Gordonia (in: high G+C Gram-positive bacteria) TaxID=2657482 RepID=UPI001FFFFC30|nr:MULTISPECIES: LppX_LprAFG lipoprotein [unclassified Gordonia (in: high G+C Gram-positive bacteria)]UQE76411.1 LppX_LprAFG lipoprotein [Gordonia sp. PP30]